jgi:hypothetical protein
MKKQTRLPASEYESYIKSNAWRAKRQRYFASKLPQNCLVCNDSKVHLHHRTYSRLGFERLQDLVPLCQKHHSECHQFLERSGMGHWGGTKHYLRSVAGRHTSGKGSYKLPEDKKAQRLHKRNKKREKMQFWASGRY